MAEDILTILARLVAEDQATQNINKVTASLDALTKQLGKNTEETKRQSKESEQNSISLTKMQNAIVGAQQAIAGLAAVRFLEGLHEQGEIVRKNTNTFNALTGSIENATTTLNSLRQATHGMVTDSDLMAGANQLLKTGLASTNEEAVKLIGLSHSLGATTDQLFSVLANQSYKVLDSFGVASGAVRSLSEEFRKAGMSSDEAFKQAFLEEAQKTVEKLGDSIEQNISPSEQLQVKWQNFWDGVSARAANVLNNALTTAEQIGYIIDTRGGELPEASQQQEIIDSAQVFVDRWSSSFKKAIESQTGGITLGGVDYNEFLQRVREAPQQIGTGKSQTAYFEQAASDMWLNDAQKGILFNAYLDVIEKAQQASMAGSSTAYGTNPYENYGLKGKSSLGLDEVASNIGLLANGAIETTHDLSELNGQVKANSGALGEHTTTLKQSIESMLKLSGTISDDIAKMLGYTPKEQREKEGAERSVVSALRREGVKGEQLDAVMSQGQANLQAAAAAGLDVSNPQVIQAAYGISDLTPGQGSDASFVGLANSPKQQVALIQALLRQGTGNYETAFNNFQQTPSLYTGAYQDQLMRSQGGFLAAGQGGNASQLYQGLQPESPANFGGMNYSNLDQYKGTLPDDLQQVADQSTLVTDDDHLGKVPIVIDSANDKMTILQSNLDNITNTQYSVEINPVIKTAAAQDNFSKWIIEILRKNGFNV